MINYLKSSDKISGIYCIIHKYSLMCYIGSSVNVRKRLMGHVAASKSAPRQVIARALREFGVDNFDFELIETCSKENLLGREEFWIKFFNSTVDGFNVVKNPTDRTDNEIKASTRRRISDSKRGIPRSEETRKKLSEANVGFVVPLSRREQISETLKGRKKTPEHIEKVRQALIKRKWTPEQHQHFLLTGEGLISKRDMSPEGRVRKARQGRPHTDQSKARIRESLTGKKLSPESIAKRTASVKKKSAERKALKAAILAELNDLL